MPWLRRICLLVVLSFALWAAVAWWFNGPQPEIAAHAAMQQFTTGDAHAARSTSSNASAWRLAATLVQVFLVWACVLRPLIDVVHRRWARPRLTDIQVASSDTPNKEVSP
jgi:hypothetical protein